ncbi:hypothetical protein SAMN05660748_2793 [Blastococcus aggregatus]|uniref:Uncharacterized protein n=1 Tax=Blastococcus aggregatus TaxID=38502 RepID=A0A285V7E6_9ACTN|nr:hypothetical protein SAMN05660748_2793 [Blastococcus aggregatus]
MADPVAVDRAYEAVGMLIALVRRTPATTDADHFVVSSVVADIRRAFRTLHPMSRDRKVCGVRGSAGHG